MDVIEKGEGEWAGSFTATRKVTALRKNIRCSRCGKLLAKGSPAIRKSGVFEAQFFSEYACADPCRALEAN